MTPGPMVEAATQDLIYWPLEAAGLALMIAPTGYAIYFIGVGVMMMLDIPFIGAKLANYQQAEDTGQSMAGVNVFGPISYSFPTSNWKS